MADEKYANLAGLAENDDPDVYETEDPSPEEDQSRSSPRDALSSWELCAEDEQQQDSETHAEKFHRIQLDFSYLQRQIHELQQSQCPRGPERGGAGGSVATGDAVADLELIKQQLASCRVSGVALSAPAPCTPLGADCLERLLCSQQPTVYTLQVAGGSRDPQRDADQSAVVAQLEQRLHSLEQHLGPPLPPINRLTLSEDGSELQLLSAVQQLSSCLQQLPAVAHTEPLVQTLHQRMNQIAEMRESLKSTARDSQLEQLCELVSQAECADAQADAVADQLVRLDSLHSRAANFEQLVGLLEASQTELDSRLQLCQQQLEQLRQTSHDQLAQLSQQLITVSEAADSAGL